MTNIQKLESAIRQALPELMELSEGCIVQSDIHGKGIVKNVRTVNDIDYVKISYNYIINEFYRSEFTIIGVPPNLLHLLRWLGEEGVHSDFSIMTNRLNFGRGVMLEYGVSSFTLDLSKPLLSQQSEEVIEELVKLLK